jgi:hypothetical protein
MMSVPKKWMMKKGGRRLGVPSDDRTSRGTVGYVLQDCRRALCGFTRTGSTQIQTFNRFPGYLLVSVTVQARPCVAKERGYQKNPLSEEDRLRDDPAGKI